MKKVACSIWGLFHLIAAVYCQDFGANPPHIKWRQIDTDTVRVIFPEGFEKQAQRTVNSIHYLSKNNIRSIGNKTGKINILCQTATTISNGYVGLAPLRSEFYFAPPQDPYAVGTMDWMDILTIHEYRHVLQNYNARVGITKLAYLLQGDVGWAVLANLSLPNWFFEGDAVVTETALSHSGRGRLPSFTLEQRALFMDRKQYRYIKVRNGSYKDLLPDRYPLGYSICNYTREHFGNDIWKTVVADAARYKGVFFPFSRSLKRHTGLTAVNLYNAAYSEAATRYQQYLATLQLSTTTPINTRNKNKTVTNYQYPYFITDSTVLCIKNSYKKTTQFIILNNKGEEKKLLSKGVAVDHYYTYKHGKLAWTELAYDPRWTNRNYSEVVTYDLRTRKLNRLTRHANYFSPEFSNKGDRLIVAHISTDKKYALKILDAVTGAELKALPNPDNQFFFHPKWTSDDKAIVVVAKKNGKLALVKYTIEDGLEEQLTTYTTHVISHPFIRADTIYFSSSLNGIDNIYALKTGEKTIYQVSSVALGAYQPVISPDGDFLAFTTFTRMGNDLSRMKLDPAFFKIVQLTDASIQDSVAVKNEGGSILDNIPHTLYPVKKYAPWAQAINIHSWQLIFDDRLRGLTLLSQNILNTLNANLQAYYNTNDSRLTSSFNTIYGEWYALVSLGAGKINDFSNRTVKINEHFFSAGLSLPLNFSRGLYLRQLTLSCNGAYRQLTAESEIETLSAVVETIESKVTFSNVRIKAYQNINSSWGQLFSFTYSTALNRNTNQLLAVVKLLLPGCMPNHSLVLESAYQKRINYTTGYRFADNFSYPRGYSTPFAYKDILKMGVNYHLPLFYPDWGINGIIYFKRIRLNMFYDYGFMNLTNLSNQLINMRSYGTEVMTDAALLNTLPISLGIRVSRLLDINTANQNRKSAIEFYWLTNL